MTRSDAQLTFTCDTCGRTQTTPRDYVGPLGWFVVTQPQNGKWPSWHFCSAKCLKECERYG